MDMKDPRAFRNGAEWADQVAGNAEGIEELWRDSCSRIEAMQKEALDLRERLTAAGVIFGAHVVRFKQLGACRKFLIQALRVADLFAEDFPGDLRTFSEMGEQGGSPWALVDRKR